MPKFHSAAIVSAVTLDGSRGPKRRSSFHQPNSSRHFAYNVSGPMMLIALNTSKSSASAEGSGSSPALALIEQLAAIFVRFAPGQAFHFDPVGGAGAIREVLSSLLLHARQRLLQLAETIFGGLSLALLARSCAAQAPPVARQIVELGGFLDPLELHRVVETREPTAPYIKTMTAAVCFRIGREVKGSPQVKSKTSGGTNHKLGGSFGSGGRCRLNEVDHACGL